jgi:uncharacterized SAM-binding protein YcdF (DUF218 family)
LVRRYATVWWLVGAVGIPALLAGLYGLVRLGPFLHSEDVLSNADAIFVFGGTRIQRPLEAADLYRQGFAPRLVLTRIPVEDGIPELARRGVTTLSGAEFSHDILRQLDIPGEAVILPKVVHDNTAEEVRTLRELSVRHRWSRVILVSSNYHLRRVHLAARRELKGTDVAIVLRSSRYDRSAPVGWWRRRSDIREVMTETPKLVAYWLGLGI